MKLSTKAVGFIIEALEHYKIDQDKRLLATDLSEDEISDLVNDRQYLDAIKKDLEKYRNELICNREGVEV